MRQYRLRERLRAGETVFGTFVSLPEPGIVEIVGAAGFDFALIDMEHTAIDIGTLIRMLTAADAASITPIVRVGTAEANSILPVLDSGAAGVVVAHVQTAEQAKQLVEACRYSPEGRRGVSGGSRAAAYGAHAFVSHTRQSNEQVLTVALIEDVAGVENIEEIASVPGLDVILPGPGDLSASLGFIGQPGHPEVQSAVARVQEAVQARGVRLGYHIMDTSQLQLCQEMGATFIVYSQDSRVIYQSYHETAAALRSAATLP